MRLAPRSNRTSVPRGSQDLVKKVLLLCICVIASMTLNTLPYLQRVLDRAINDSPFLIIMDDYPSVATTSSARRAHHPHNQQTKLISESSSSSCLTYQTIRANFTHVKNADTSRLMLRQPTPQRCGRLRRDWSGRAPPMASM